MEISQFHVPTTPHHPHGKEPPVSTDPRLGRPQNWSRYFGQGKYIPARNQPTISDIQPIAL